MIAIIAIVALFVVVVASALYLIHRERSFATQRIRDHERTTRVYEQRQDELLDRLAHAYDKPWQEPPVEAVEKGQDDPDPDLTWDASFLEDEYVTPGSGGTF